MAMQPIIILPDLYPKVQLAQSNPDQWNTRWEAVYDMPIGYLNPDRLLLEVRSLRKMFGGSGKRTADDKHRYTVNYETTCAMRHRIGKKMLEAFAKDDFENRWLSATVEERRKHALAGLANGGAQANNLNTARAYCSDILRLRYLADDGEVLLKLLKDLTPQDISSVPKEPYYFPNAGWDSLRTQQQGNTAASEDDKLDLLEILILRTKLIYFVAEGIMASFMDVALPKLTANKQRNCRPEGVKKEETRFFEEEYPFYGEDVEMRLREELAALDKGKSRREVHCENCEKTQGQGEKFMRCSKCWDTNKRDVKYCGKDCQLADWKARHKRICGKTLETAEEVLNNFFHDFI